MRSHRSLLGLVTALCLALPNLSLAAGTFDVAIHSGDIEYSAGGPVVGVQTRIYLRVSDLGDRDVEGTVHFLIDENEIGAKPFSVRANGSPEEVWMRWTPNDYGNHTIRITVENDQAYPDPNLANNQVIEEVFVDRDTDKDGVPDQVDLDGDNDGIPNEQEISARTNPFKKDTDGDGVNDREDLFPLDSTKSAPPTPPKEVAPLPVTPDPAPVAKPVIVQTSPVAVVSKPKAVVATPAAPVKADVAYVEPTVVPAVTSTVLAVVEQAQAMEPAEVAPTIIATTSTPTPPPAATSTAMTTVLTVAAVVSAAGTLAFIWLARSAA